MSATNEIDLSPRLRELFRMAATRMHDDVADIAQRMWISSQQTLRDDPLALDPLLSETDRLFTRSTLTHWVIANIDDPGSRVEPTMIPDTRFYARDLALRGLAVDDVEGWRAAQRVVWSAWLRICFDVAEDRDELRELIEVSGNSIGNFIDDTLAAVVAFVEQARAELAEGPEIERLATVQLILRGAPITRPRAEARLGHALTGPHLAAVVWADSPDRIAELDDTAEKLMRATGAGRRLTILAGAATMWVWVAASAAPPAAELDRIVASHPGCRITIGRPGQDIHGFRRSHADAAAAQALLVRLRSGHRAARFEDVQLVSLLTGDLAEARQFVGDVLGELADSEPVLRETARAFIAEQFNISKTADRLFAHRNTIVRRLARIDELLPQPLAVNPAVVDAALALVALSTPAPERADVHDG